MKNMIKERKNNGFALIATLGAVTLALLMQGSGGGLILRIIKPLELLIKQALQRVIERLVKLRKLYPAINAKMHPFR